jgi:hypothetical protein
MPPVTQALGGVFLEGAKSAYDLSGVLAQLVLDAWLLAVHVAQVPKVEREVAAHRGQREGDAVPERADDGRGDSPLVMEKENRLLMDGQWHDVPVAGNLPMLADAGRHVRLAKRLPEQPVAEVIGVVSLQVPAVQEALFVEVCQLRARFAMRSGWQRDDRSKRTVTVLRDRCLLSAVQRHGPKTSVPPEGWR